MTRLRYNPDGTRPYHDEERHHVYWPSIHDIDDPDAVEEYLADDDWERVDNTDEGNEIQRHRDTTGGGTPASDTDDPIRVQPLDDSDAASDSDTDSTADDPGVNIPSRDPRPDSLDDSDVSPADSDDNSSVVVRHADAVSEDENQEPADHTTATPEATGPTSDTAAPEADDPEARNIADPDHDHGAETPDVADADADANTDSDDDEFAPGYRAQPTEDDVMDAAEESPSQVSTMKHVEGDMQADDDTATNAESDADDMAAEDKDADVDADADEDVATDADAESDADTTDDAVTDDESGDTAAGDDAEAEMESEADDDVEVDTGADAESDGDDTSPENEYDFAVDGSDDTSPEDLKETVKGAIEAANREDRRDTDDADADVTPEDETGEESLEERYPRIFDGYEDRQDSIDDFVGRVGDSDLSDEEIWEIIEYEEAHKDRKGAVEDLENIVQNDPGDDSDGGESDA